MHRKIIIGTRGSALALWQANYVKDHLASLEVKSELKVIKTQGDHFLNVTFNKLLGKGFFTKEIEEELLRGDIDLAVHSHKDLPTEQPPGLIIGAVTERENPSDLLLIHPDAVDIKQAFSLRERAIVGTASGRRRSQLLAYRPDLEMMDIRGNVPSRIQKLLNGEYDAILIAQAGVDRLEVELEGLHVEKLTPQQIIPAPAQGVLALQIRQEDTELAGVLAKIHSKPVKELINIERQILNLFEGGCRTPVGAYCIKENGQYQVWVSKAEAEDKWPVRYFACSKTPEGLPERIVEKYSSAEKKIKSVFISRDLSGDSYFRRALNALGIEAEARSMIKTFPIITTFNSFILKRADWIFFSSKSAIDYFFRLKPVIPKKTRIGVVGRGSEQELRNYGQEADFVGRASDIPHVGKKFAEIADGTTVVFPAAKDSLRTVQQELSENTTIIDLPIYETVPDHHADASSADVLIFTSPSNVEAYMGPYLIDSNQKVVAIGKSTGAKLEEYGITNYIMPYAPDEVGLAEAVFEFV